MTSNGTEDIMWTQAGLITRITAHAVKVAQAAGAVVKQVVKEGNLGVVEKLNASDLQTKADRAAQYCIIHSLTQKFGEKLCVIGEEERSSEEAVKELCADVSSEVLHYNNQCDSDLTNATFDDIVVWVDPVDGTKEFSQGAVEKSNLLEQTTTLIGISFKGQAVAGVVHQPFYGFKQGCEDYDKLGRTVWAIRGAGVHGMNVQPADSGKQTVVTTRSHGNQCVTDTIESLAQAGMVDEVLRVGGAGYKVLRVLDGDHAYVFASLGCKKWDTCAPEIILVEAGGMLSDMSGGRYTYEKDVQHMNDGGVLATAVGVNHNKYLALIPDSVKDKLCPGWKTRV